MVFSKTNNSLTVIFIENGKSKPMTITNSHPNWNAILEALKASDEVKLKELMDIGQSIEVFTEANIVVKNGNVFYKNRQLHGLDVIRLLEYIKENIPYISLMRFLERKMANPSMRSIEELYKFLEHRGMPLTSEGKILGYKGICNDDYSVNGNLQTVILSGEVDSSGHILNTIGAEIRIERSSVCDDYKIGCSTGLHIGSLEYARGWGNKVVVVEFDPADVVSVPDDCSCQKLRVCAYKVIAAYEDTSKSLPNAYTNQYPTANEQINPDIEHDDADYKSKPNNPVDDTENSQYKLGYEIGTKDGKAHNVRECYDADLNDSLNDDEWDYVSGYNAGYKKARYNK